MQTITYTETEIKPTFMKKLIIPIVMVAALIGSTLSAKAQTADEIVDKYIAAIGGKENWKKVQSMKVDGAIQVQGLEIPYTVNAVHMKGNRMQGEFQGNVFIEITTPTKGWSQNPMQGKATLQPITDDELKTKIDDLDIQSPFIDYKEKGSIIESLGKDEEDGNEYFKIKLTTKNKNETTYFIDTKTFLVYKQETLLKQQGQEIKMAVKSLDYQTIEGGIKVPFKVDQGQMIMATKKVTVNPTIDEKLFTNN